MSRPEISKITTESIRTEIRDHGGLRVEPNFREDVRNLLKDSRNANDPNGIAYTAFTLAYSLDHYEPYDFNQAVQLLGEVLAHFPEWTDAYFNRGVARIHSKDFESAIQDLETANSYYSRQILGGGEATPQINIRKGKLLMFLAEAHSRRGNPGDMEIARSELLRAEPYLLQCLGDTDLQTRVSAQFWIDEIPDRLKSLFPDNLIPDNEKKSTAVTVTHPFGFLLGLILVPLILWWIVATATPEKAEPRKKTELPTANNPVLSQSSKKPSKHPKDKPAGSKATPSQEKKEGASVPK